MKAEQKKVYNPASDTARFSLYGAIAKKHDTTHDYVYLINSGKRKANRGKALLIKQELEKFKKLKLI